MYEVFMNMYNYAIKDICTLHEHKLIQVTKENLQKLSVTLQFTYRVLQVYNHGNTCVNILNL